MSDLKIKATQWEHITDLPHIEYNLYQKLYRKSQIRDGARMVPYVWIDKEKHFLY